jgi:hypothetical protein
MPLCDDLRYFRETGDSTFDGALGSGARPSVVDLERERDKLAQREVRRAAILAEWIGRARPLLAEYDLNAGPSRDQFRNTIQRMMKDSGMETSRRRPMATRVIAALRMAA